MMYEFPRQIGSAKKMTAGLWQSICWSSSDFLATLTEQPGAAFGMVATLASSIDWRVSIRYGGELLPEVLSDQVSYLHDLELQLGGTF